MNRKKALTILIQHSFSLPNETILRLLDAVETLDDAQVEALGQYLAAERQYVLQHERAFRSGTDEILKALAAWQSDTQGDSGNPA